MLLLAISYNDHLLLRYSQSVNYPVCRLMSKPEVFISFILLSYWSLWNEMLFRINKCKSVKFYKVVLVSILQCSFLLCCIIIPYSFIPVSVDIFEVQLKMLPGKLYSSVMYSNCCKVNTE